jgi:hypothetical protein
LNQPTFQTNQFNARPAVSFNQADPEFMTGSLGNLDAPAALVAVGYFNQANQAPADSDYIIGIGEPPLNSSLPGVRASISRRWPDNGTTRADRYYSYDGEYEYYGPVVSGQSLHIMSSVFQSSFPFHQVAIDGAFSRAVTGPIALNTNGDYDLGRLISQNQFDLDGRIAEVIVYRTALNTTQMRILQSALAAKWGVTIQNDLYNGDDAIIGDFDAGVAGIGRTIDGDVGIAQSGGLTLSLGTAAALGSFLMVGHSGISSATQVTDIGSNSATLTWRLTTQWYASLTGSLGNTTSFTLDFGDMGISGEPSLAANRYGILYRAGTSGNWTVLASAQSISGDQLIFANITLPANGYVTFARLDQPLPIELVRFVAGVVEESNRRMVALNWETKTEIDNDYFTIERSVDGRTWGEVAIVPGAGTTKAISQYVCLDKHPFRGISYYRLAQTDFDGKRVFVGNLARVEIKERSNQSRCVPNPASNELTIIFDTVPEAGTSYEILDIMGKRMLKDLLVERESQIALDLRDGIYLMRVYSAGDIQTHRLIVRSSNK